MLVTLVSVVRCEVDRSEQAEQEIEFGEVRSMQSSRSYSIAPNSLLAGTALAFCEQCSDFTASERSVSMRGRADGSLPSMRANALSLALPVPRVGQRPSRGLTL